MKDGPDISRVAALIGDPARANILTALMSGKALTASELAGEAGVTLQTASAHLSKLEGGGLIALRREGRHKYFRLAGDEVAEVLEALMGLAAGTGALRTRPGPRDPEMRRARVCYNHLAGDMGTQMYDALLAQGVLRRSGQALELTEAGREFVTGFGIDLHALPRSRAPLCRDCLDWSERRSHLAGQLGRAMLSRMEEIGWAARVDGTRVVRFSRTGEAAFSEVFGEGARLT
ncbi:Cadmium resistance transcriptional regulatory protein CadC [Roseovarius sp. THAF27]|uniref:ArsR/SmtB family transcription factor n=1 Tax=Roseovarius sp. THAF27 TaxID=2587850 RepID=UPI0012682632|nr:winged helix-turn-helix domain-containing protein [Roseovarius sp. THAF27]QFT79063.1 Cadmium resistance transcriptional regulatory protein CadC [Roseovarius sp. THAF27]